MFEQLIPRTTQIKKQSGDCFMDPFGTSNIITFLFITFAFDNTNYHISLCLPIMMFSGQQMELSLLNKIFSFKQEAFRYSSYIGQ